jgi:nicotianamine synthase-like protein
VTNETAILALAGRVLQSTDADIYDRRRCVVEFEKALLGFSGPDDARLLQDLSPMFPQLNLAYERFETDLEEEFSERLLVGDTNVKQYPLYGRFVRLVSNEVGLLNLNSGDQIAMVGSGPFPISSIIFSVHFGMRVIAVERNRNAAILSERVVKHLGLQNDIKVECGHGQQLVSDDVSSAIIALLAKPKDAILDNVFRNFIRCASVICRTSHGIRQALYAPTDMKALQPYNIIDTHLATGDQTISSILLAQPAGSPRIDLEWSNEPYSRKT